MKVVLEDKEQMTADAWWTDRRPGTKLILFWQYCDSCEYMKATAEQRLFIYQRETSTPSAKEHALNTK